MKKLFILLLFGIFFINLASINADLGTWAQNECVPIRILSNASDVNLSTITISSDLLVINEPMTNLVGQTFNYTFCNTTTLGTYVYDWQPCDNLECVNSFTITKSGTILGISESILYIVLILINLLVFIFFLYWTIAFPYSNKTNEKGEITAVTKTKYLKLLSALFAYGSFLWFFAMFTGIINNFISLEIYRGLISNLYIILHGVGLGFVLLILMIILVEIWRDILFNKEIQKYGKAIIKGR